MAVPWLIAVGSQSALRAAPRPEAGHVAPSAPLLRLATVGDAPLAASLLWMRTTTAWAAGDAPAAWTSANVHACLDLDPTWPAPARYGALMLAADGDLDAHEAVLARAIGLFDDPWFARMLAASRYLHRGDVDGAARWLEVAGADDPLSARAAERLRGRLR